MKWITNPVADFKKEAAKVFELQKLIERIQKILQSQQFLVKKP